MKVARRVAVEYAIQVVGFLVTLADRLLIAGVLLRYWGVTDFALWSVLSAAAGLLAFFDVGVNAYFVNRIMIHVQRGEREAAQRAQRAGNALLFTTSLFGVLVVLIGFGIYAAHSGSVALNPSVWVIVSCLTLATWLRMVISVQAAVYRAHNELGRGSLWLFGMDAVRIIGTVAGAVVGAGLITVAVLQLALVTIAAALIVLWDTGRRYPGFDAGFATLPMSERREMMVISLGYWVQGAPNAVLTYAPVMFLSSSKAGAAVVAQFVLMRTIGNLVRTVLQLFALVLGTEAARRFARGELTTLATSYRESMRLLAVQAACAAGALIALGAPSFRMWTGHGGIFDETMLLLAVLPPVLVPSAALMQAFLGSINRPYPLAAARVAQVLVTLVALVALPVENEGRRLLAAIGLGEILGFAIPINVFLGRNLIPGTGLLQLIDGTVRAVLGGTATYLVVREAYLLFGEHVLLGLAVATIVAGGMLVVLTLLFGMNRRRLPVLYRRAQKLIG